VPRHSIFGTVYDMTRQNDLMPFEFYHSELYLHPCFWHYASHFVVPFLAHLIKWEPTENDSVVFTCQLLLPLVHRHGRTYCAESFIRRLSHTFGPRGSCGHSRVMVADQLTLPGDEQHHHCHTQVVCVPRPCDLCNIIPLLFPAGVPARKASSRYQLMRLSQHRLHSALQCSPLHSSYFGSFGGVIQSNA